MDNWKPSDFVVLLLALTVCVVIVLAVATPEDFLPEKNAELIAGAVSSIIAIISMYIGLKLRSNSTDEELLNEEQEES